MKQPNCIEAEILGQVKFRPMIGQSSLKKEEKMWKINFTHTDCYNNYHSQ